MFPGLSPDHCCQTQLQFPSILEFLLRFKIPAGQDLIGSVWVRWVSLGPIPVARKLEYIDWPGLSIGQIVSIEADNFPREPHYWGKGSSRKEREVLLPEEGQK